MAHDECDGGNRRLGNSEEGASAQRRDGFVVSGGCSSGDTAVGG